MNFGAAQPGVQITLPGTGTPAPPATPTVTVGIVWRPNVPTAGNHVQTWLEVEAFLGTLTPDQNPTVYVDSGGLENAAIPTAATSLAGRTTLAAFTSEPEVITIADGAYIRDPFALLNVALVGAPTTTPFLHLTRADSLVLLSNSGIQLLGGATVPAVNASADQTGLLLTNGSYLYNSASGGPVAVVNVDVGSLTHVVGVIGAVGSTMFDPSTFSSTDASATINLITDASTLVVAQPLFLGTWSPRIVDKASTVSYDDSAVAPPLGVTQVQAAIDALKAGAVVSATASIVWRPGVGSAGNHVATWAEVATFIAANGGATVYVDTSVAAATVPAVITPCFGRVTLDAYTSLPVLVTVADGGQLQNLFKVGAVQLRGSPTTIPFLRQTAAGTLFVDTGEIVLGSAATVPAIQSDAQNALVLTVGGNVTNSSLATAFCNIAAGTLFELFSTGGSPIAANIFSGGPTATLALALDASVPYVVQSSFTGTLTIAELDFATAVKYNDALVSPPLGATLVQGAIDALKVEVVANAAAITALQSQMVAALAQLANLPASITEGTWTPTYSNLTNLGSVSGSVGQYVQIGTGSGSIIIGSFLCTPVVTAPTAACKFNFSLPAAATFATQNLLSGSGTASASTTTTTSSMRLEADTVANLGAAQWTAINAVSTATYALFFMYRIP